MYIMMAPAMLCHIGCLCCTRECWLLLSCHCLVLFCMFEAHKKCIGLLSTSSASPRMYVIMLHPAVVVPTGLEWKHDMLCFLRCL